MQQLALDRIHRFDITAVTMDMSPEILLKAYVRYQSEDAFRELVAGTLDEVYSAAFQIVHRAPHLAGEVSLCVYLDLARKAPGLGEEVKLASWLRERTCKMAVRVLRAEERAIDWPAVKSVKNALLAPTVLEPAPPGLAIRICQSVFLSAARRRRRWLSLPQFSWPHWIRPVHVGGVAVFALVIIVWWDNPFRQRHPIIRSQGPPMTPSSFAQLASPEEISVHISNVNVVTNTNSK